MPSAVRELPHRVGWTPDSVPRRIDWTPWLLLAPTFLVIFLVGVYPLLYSLWISFNAYHPTNPSFPSGFIGFDNYVAMFSDPAAIRSFLLTVGFAVADVAATLLLGLTMALLFVRDRPGFGALRAALLIPMFIAPIAVGITWRIMYNPGLGILNYMIEGLGLEGRDWLGSTSSAFTSVLIVDVWQWTPFMFLILFAGLRSLPRSPMEAASIDGASKWQIFFLVTLPLLKPVIALAVVLRFIDAFRTFDQIFMMTRGGPNFATDLMSIYLHRVNFKFFDVGYGAALSWTFLAFLAIVTAVFLRLVIARRQ